MAATIARRENLVELFKKVDESPLTASEYFKENDTFISLPQYYRLRKRFDSEGADALKDRRILGNARKINPEIIRSVLTYKREMTSQEIQAELFERWGIQLHKSRIDQYRRQFGLPRIKPDTSKESEGEEFDFAQFAGVEIFSAIACHLGILDHYHAIIKKRVEEIKQTDEYRSNRGKGDHIHMRRQGKFSPRYNRLKQIRETKFSSIDEKVKTKDFSRISIFSNKADTIHKKNLSLLFLPLVTNNGAMRTIDKPLGNAIENVCGFNYKNATMDKYLRELKYLRISSDMIACNARFWDRLWKKEGFNPGKTACYYIDGNVKPLWSSKRCRKSKVTMLGRVMGCLEQVVIHDGYGHPIYFKTFSGGASLDNHALKSMEELNQLLNDGSPENSRNSTCSRVLVLDAGGNSVETLRSFKDHYFITILDANQTNQRKFKQILLDERYHHGDATLIESAIELKDSKDPDYIYECRAVRVYWDNGRQCCLITNIPEEIFDASGVVKAYFDRWPLCEKQYAMMKASVCFNQIVGYGKKHVDDDNMQQRIKEYQISLSKLRKKLQVPLSKIHEKEQSLIKLISKERKLKENSIIKDGKRIQSKKNKVALDACQKEIRKIERGIKKIEKPFQKEFASLRKKNKEFCRIQGKDKVYHVDTELDQLLTVFRLSLANTLAFFIKKILDDKPMEMNTLIQSVLFLDGKVKQTSDIRFVHIRPNQKDPTFMECLEKGLERLNQLDICHLNGTKYCFKMAT